MCVLASFYQASLIGMQGNRGCNIPFACLSYVNLQLCLVWRNAQPAATVLILAPYGEKKNAINVK